MNWQPSPPYTTPKFSDFSIANLETCDERLRQIFHEVIKHVDCRVLEGHRDKERQNFMVAQRKSGLPWPKSKHNSVPSRAVDVVPYPIDWNNLQRFAMFAGFVKGIATEQGIPLRCGIDWNGNFDPTDNWIDAPHFEIIGD